MDIDPSLMHLTVLKNIAACQLGRHELTTI